MGSRDDRRVACFIRLCVERNRMEKRVAKWDNAKGILIYMIVLTHVGEKWVLDYVMLKRMLMFFHILCIPCFLFMAGYFGRNIINERRYEKIFSYLVLYVFMKMLNTVSIYIGSGKWEFRLWSDKTASWFAFAMCVYYLLMIVLKNVDKWWLFCAAVLLSCFTGYDTSIGDFLILGRIFVFFPFFLAGYHIDMNKTMKMIQNRWVKLAAVICLILVVGMCYFKIDSVFTFRGFFSGSYSYEEALGRRAVWGAIYKLVQYVLSFVTIFAFLCLMPDKRLGNLSVIGRKTLPIYAYHLFFINAFMRNIELNGICKPNGLACVGIVFLLSAVDLLICQSKPLCIVLNKVITFRKE